MFVQVVDAGGDLEGEAREQWRRERRLRVVQQIEEAAARHKLEDERRQTVLHARADERTDGRVPEL